VIGLDLSSRVAVVTGAAGGIGGGIAEVLAAAGALTVIADIDAERAKARAETLNGDWVGLDLTSEASVVAACAEVARRHGAPWVVVNNAGLQDREMLLDGTAEFWDRTLSVNTRGAYLMSREAARAMVAAGRGGRIVNIASASVVGALCKGHAAYASSKAALEGLTRACALELVEHGITVNTVLPGGVATPGSIGAKGPPPEGPGRRAPPLGLCDAADIGKAVLFLASDLAARITNQSLAVDAGWSIT
jgi:NAD(P)-dependent dehydrogenase (short-subunit alcohol dehydrogenase family)